MDYKTCFRMAYDALNKYKESQPDKLADISREFGTLSELGEPLLTGLLSAVYDEISRTATG